MPFDEVNKFTAPNNCVVTTKDVYGFLDADGKLIKKENVTEVGAYKMNGYVLITVKGKAAAASAGVDISGDTAATERTFLIWKDETRALNLRIDRRPVTVISSTAAAAYSGRPLIRSNYSLNDTLINTNDVDSDMFPAVVNYRNRAALLCGDILIIGEEVKGTGAAALAEAAPFLEENGLAVIFFCRQSCSVPECFTPELYCPE